MSLMPEINVEHKHSTDCGHSPSYRDHNNWALKPKMGATIEASL